jgi:hypothetical protein
MIRTVARTGTLGPDRFSPPRAAPPLLALPPTRHRRWCRLSSRCLLAFLPAPLLRSPPGRGTRRGVCGGQWGAPRAGPPGASLRRAAAAAAATGPARATTRQTAARRPGRAATARPPLPRARAPSPLLGGPPSRRQRRRQHRRLRSVKRGARGPAAAALWRRRWRRRWRPRSGWPKPVTGLPASVRRSGWSPVTRPPHHCRRRRRRRRRRLAPWHPQRP